MFIIMHFLNKYAECRIFTNSMKWPFNVLCVAGMSDSCFDELEFSDDVSAMMFCIDVLCLKRKEMTIAYCLMIQLTPSFHYIYTDLQSLYTLITINVNNKGNRNSISTHFNPCLLNSLF